MSCFKPILPGENGFVKRSDDSNIGLLALSVSCLALGATLGSKEFYFAGSAFGAIFVASCVASCIAYLKDHRKDR